MAITATYKTASVEYKDAYIKLQRIWGSKEEGWNAWVAVFAKEGDKEQKELFSVSVPYVEDENPFKALYGAVERLSFVLTKKKLEGAMEPITLVYKPFEMKPIPVEPEPVVEIKQEEKKVTKGRKKKV